jgi:2-polyprenyl-3-methyl-5-hydroxy-6-metoxy-1,4-benzoquinol methylase
MIDLPIELFEYVDCDICNRRETKRYLHMKDYLYSLPGTFSIVKCTSCGLLFTNPRPKSNLIPDLYSKYYGGIDSNASFNNARTIKPLFQGNITLRKLYHWMCGQYLGEVLTKARGRVLDIGCGSGSLLEELMQLGCIGYGIEPNMSAAQACIEKGLNVTCGVLNSIDYPDNFFDTVIMWHVIEHLPSPKSTLKKVHKILKPGGHVFIYCPNADSYMTALFHELWRGWHLPFHFYHFTPDTMSKLVKAIDFKKILMRTVTPDFIFPKSLEVYIENQRKNFQWIIKKGLFRSMFFRLLAGFNFRLLDACFGGKGECLQVELEKP